MTARATLIALVAPVALVLAAVVLWPEREGTPPRSFDSISQEAPAVDAEHSAATAEGAVSAHVSAAIGRAGADGREPGARGSAAPSNEERIAGMTQQIADDLYREVGEGLVSGLVAGGLARSDGEAIVKEAMQAGASCLFDALRQESEAQSVAFGAVLDAMEAGLSDSDGPLVTAFVDMAAVQQRAQPCMLNAAQEAGIPLP